MTEECNTCKGTKRLERMTSAGGTDPCPTCFGTGKKPFNKLKCVSKSKSKRWDCKDRCVDYLNCPKEKFQEFFHKNDKATQK